MSNHDHAKSVGVVWKHGLWSLSRLVNNPNFRFVCFGDSLVRLALKHDQTIGDFQRIEGLRMALEVTIDIGARKTDHNRFFWFRLVEIDYGLPAFERVNGDKAIDLLPLLAPADLHPVAHRLQNLTLVLSAECVVHANQLADERNRNLPLDSLLLNVHGRKNLALLFFG